MRKLKKFLAISTISLLMLPSITAFAKDPRYKKVGPKEEWVYVNPKSSASKTIKYDYKNDFGISNSWRLTWNYYDGVAGGNKQNHNNSYEADSNNLHYSVNSWCNRNQPTGYKNETSEVHITLSGKESELARHYRGKKPWSKAGTDSYDKEHAGYGWRTSWCGSSGEYKNATSTNSETTNDGSEDVYYHYQVWVYFASNIQVISKNNDGTMQVKLSTPKLTDGTTPSTTITKTCGEITGTGDHQWGAWKDNA